MPIIFDDATGKWLDDQTGDFVDDPNLPVPNAPAPSGEWAGWDAAVTALYQKYLKRTPPRAEVIPHRGNPRGMNGVEAAILASDEYKSLPPAPTNPTDPEGPKDGNYQAWFQSLVSGKAPTPAELIKLEPLLNKYGIKVLRNAAGVAGKIQLPDGKAVDVIVGASRGGEGWSWQTGEGGGTSSQAASTFDPSTFGEFNEKWTQQFTPVPYTPSPAFAPTTPAQSPFSFTAPTVTPFTYEDFIPPTAADMTDDPGYKIRLAEGLKAIDTSAAAHGTLLTGGTLKGLTKYGQEQGSNEFQNVYNRKASTWTANRGNAMDVWNSKKSLSDTAFSQATSAWDRNATANESALNRENSVWQNNDAANYRNWTAQNQTKLTDYQQKYKIWFEQQQGAFDRLYKLSALGQNTAVNS